MSHCSCTALMFNLSFGSSPLQRSCKTVDVREPHEVSFLRLVLTLIHCKQYSAGFPHRVLPALRSVWIKVGFQRNPVFSLFTLHPFAMQQAALACCTESFPTLLFILLGKIWGMFPAFSQHMIPTSLAPDYI